MSGASCFQNGLEAGAGLAPWVWVDLDASLSLSAHKTPAGHMFSSFSFKSRVNIKVMMFAQV